MHKQKKAIAVHHIVVFIVKFSAIVLSGFGIFGFILVLFLNKKVGPTYFESVSTLSQIQAYLPYIIFITAIVQALALCMIAMLLALFWSHSIAGPLVRFRRILRDIAQGAFLKEPVVFRSADQLHGLAQAFSDLIISRKDTCAKALAVLVQAQKMLDECQALEQQGKGNSPEFQVRFKELKARYRSIQELLVLEKSD